MTTITRIRPDRATAELVITGIHCGECTAHLEMAIEAFPGVESAAIDLDSGTTTLSYRRADLDLDALLKAITAEPYGVRLISITPGA